MKKILFFCLLALTMSGCFQKFYPVGTVSYNKLDKSSFKYTPQEAAQLLVKSADSPELRTKNPGHLFVGVREDNKYVFNALFFLLNNGRGYLSLATLVDAVTGKIVKPTSSSVDSVDLDIKQEDEKLKLPIYQGYSCKFKQEWICELSKNKK